MGTSPTPPPANPPFTRVWKWLIVISLVLGLAGGTFGVLSLGSGGEQAVQRGTENVPVYFAQGGGTLVVGSGGTLRVDNGGTMTLSPGATFTGVITTGNATVTSLSSTGNLTATGSVSAKQIVINGNAYTATAPITITGVLTNVVLLYK